MNNLCAYTNLFFNDLELFEDVARGHSYKAFIQQAVLAFLENETKETAFAVYESFFDSYRITLEGKNSTFIDLLDVLRAYEENAATLIDKQRDHYIHTVNVFILGLCIYTQNSAFRAAFDAKNLDKSDYPFSYDTKHEEFFYRWGLASLFHDVGYPVEIICKQIGKFMGFATEVDGNLKINSHLEFENFDVLNSIAEIIPKREFIRSYYDKYDSCVYVDLLKPIDLLSHKLHLSLGVDLRTIKMTLDNFVDTMAKSGFVDHGFYSALIVLKWYGYLIQISKYKAEYFFYPILDSASAILLHNYYRNVLTKPPFNLGALSPNQHPIAYLLILCDELQEWNREAYGIADKKLNPVGEASILISDKRMVVTYLVKKGIFPDQFSAEKENFLYKILDLKAVFDGGFSIGCEILDKLTALAGDFKQNTGLMPRPLLDNLEKLAIAIHEKFNQKQLENHPEKPLAYPRFTDLPDTLKYSNLRQARSIFSMLELMEWEIRPIDSQGEPILKITKEEVDVLARFEHDEWMKERLSSGWRYGEEKNVDKKISPYLIPFDELDKEIKKLDQDSIRNIPELLELIGMAIYQKV
jgi:hypothetical protein